MRSIRAYGSAGINLAYLAMGAVDCYFEYGFHIWDYAGPCLLVRLNDWDDHNNQYLDFGRIFDKWPFQ